MTKKHRKLSWTLQILVAIILLQTLFFKFSGAEESKFIFQTIGFEPEGRYITAGVELLAAALILIPRCVWLGSGLALGVISGAIFSHLTKLGIVVLGDGGTLFAMAGVVFVGSAIVLFLNRSQIPFIPPGTMESNPENE